MNIENVNKIFAYLLDNYPNARNVLTISRKTRIELHEVKDCLKSLPVIFSHAGNMGYTIRKSKSDKIDVAGEVGRVTGKKHKQKTRDVVGIFVLSIAVTIAILAVFIVNN